MNKKEINIAIAKIVGWHVEKAQCSEACALFAPNGDRKSRYQYGCDTIDDFIDFVPDYYNDLNAMHEVEILMGVKEANSYFSALFEECRKDNGLEFNEFSPITAESSQRARTYLKIKG